MGLPVMLRTLSSPLMVLQCSADRQVHVNPALLCWRSDGANAKHFQCIDCQTTSAEPQGACKPSGQAGVRKVCCLLESEHAGHETMAATSSKCICFCQLATTDLRQLLEAHAEHLLGG